MPAPVPHWQPVEKVLVEHHLPWTVLGFHHVPDIKHLPHSLKRILPPEISPVRPGGTVTAGTRLKATTLEDCGLEGEVGSGEEVEK